MALSLSNFLYPWRVLLFATFALAATRTYDFTVEWVNRNPDGLQSRPVIGINGQWPIPRIEATVGDRVIVNVNNQLGNQSTSLHFHGIFMNGTNEMDGVAGVTQCPIPPGSSFTYNFTVSYYLRPQNPSNQSRFTNPALIGTILMLTGNTRTAFEDH